MDPQTQPASDAAAAILADAAALESGQVVKPGAPAAPEPDPLALARSAAAGAVELAAPFLLPVVGWRFGPEAARAYGPKQLDAIAAALAAVAVKRGWNLDELLDLFPEVMLGAAVLGPLVPIALARMQQERAGEPAAPAASAVAAVAVTSPAPAPGGSGFDGR